MKWIQVFVEYEKEGKTRNTVIELTYVGQTEKELLQFMKGILGKTVKILKTKPKINNQRPYP